MVHVVVAEETQNQVVNMLMKKGFELCTLRNMHSKEESAVRVEMCIFYVIAMFCELPLDTRFYSSTTQTVVAPIGNVVHYMLAMCRGNYSSILKKLVTYNVITQTKHARIKQKSGISLAFQPIVFHPVMEANVMKILLADTKKKISPGLVLSAIYFQDLYRHCKRFAVLCNLDPEYKMKTRPSTLQFDIHAAYIPKHIPPGVYNEVRESIQQGRYRPDDANDDDDDDDNNDDDESYDSYDSCYAVYKDTKDDRDVPKKKKRVSVVSPTAIHASTAGKKTETESFSQSIELKSVFINGKRYHYSVPQTRSRRILNFVNRLFYNAFIRVMNGCRL